MLEFQLAENGLAKCEAGVICKFLKNCKNMLRKEWGLCRFQIHCKRPLISLKAEFENSRECTSPSHDWNRRFRVKLQYRQARVGHQNELLRHPALKFRAAIPTHEPLDATYRLPSIPTEFTFIAADGSQIQPDSHGFAFYYLINVGSLVYRHGSGQAPEAYSQPTIGFTEDQVYEAGQPVTGNLLDVKRDLAEITALTDLCEAEPSGTATVAVVDGTLILWTLRDTPPADQARKAQEYLRQLDRIREAGATPAAFISRPQRGEVARLLHLANVGGDVKRADDEPNPALQRLPDHLIFASLPPGARSALFVSPSSINHDYYGPAGHTIRIFYLNLSAEGSDPVIARVEVPEWVAKDAERLALVHGAVVAQARITGDYPYALVRADELAFISSPEREAFEEMVTTSLVRAGAGAALSPKRYYKTLTRQGRRKYR